MVKYFKKVSELFIKKHTTFLTAPGKGDRKSVV